MSADNVTKKMVEKFVAVITTARSFLLKADEFILQFYDFVCENLRDNNLWRAKYGTFGDCLETEFSWSPEKFKRLGTAIERFGREWIMKYGVESAITSIRLPPNSAVERETMIKLETWYEERGRRPSPEAVTRIVSQVVAPKIGVGGKVSETVRLHEIIKELEKQLKEEKRKRLAAEKRAEVAEEKVEKLKEKLSKQ